VGFDSRLGQRDAAAAERQIRGEYETIMRNVTTAAGTAANALDGVSYALGVCRNGSDVNMAVTDFMDQNLPIWHQEHMVAVANEAYAITQNPFPTDEELARLASYDRYMYDPHFATQLMNQMGPEGLLYFHGFAPADDAVLRVEQ
jgi:hypothetical protein